VLLFPTPLWYANATHFRAEIDQHLAAVKPAPQALVLDVFGMSDLDYTGSRELSELLDTLRREKIGFALARAGQTVRENLDRSGLLARIGPEHLYSSADEAVAAFTHRGASS
jgi:SulP family sulfate permease